jgi:uncharacterized protein (DUF2062 family)
LSQSDQLDDAPASDHFRPVVIAPTYNNASTLLGVLARIQKVGVPLIVVNDGATDDTASVLAAWSADIDPLVAQVVTLPENRGKAAAMRIGFAHARQHGFTHAVTMDTDGQLSPEEIPAMLDAARASPDAMVLGTRSVHTPGLPKSNLTGWYTSSLGLWLEIGVVIRDSQCGLRVYPLKLFDVIHCRTGRFGFEAEIIARAVWAGCPVVDVPVTCHYPPREDRVSHFKPFRDGAKGFFMHWALAIRRLIPWGYARLPKHESATHSPSGTAATSSKGARPASGWESWTQWASPLALWRQVRSSRLEQLNAGAAVGHGAFMACMPLGIWIIAVVIYGSKRLHHNLFAAMLGAAIAIPPIGTWIVKAAICIGHVLTHLSFPDFSEATPGVDAFSTVFMAFPISWLVGGVILGTVLHWVAIVVVFSALRLVSTPDADSPA